MTTLRIPFAFSNVHEPGTVKQRHATIEAVLARCHGGVGGFNEARLDHTAITQLAHAHGMSALCAGENAIVWDDRFVKIASWNVPIMKGGFVGADGVATPRKGDDDRRVGPSRFLLIVVLWDPATRQAFVVWCWHLIARAGTVNKWRRGLLFGSIARAGAFLAQVLDDVGQAMGFGDTNWSPNFDIPGVAEVTVATPATMGRAHYDKVHKVGSSVSTSRVVGFNTPSDHNGLVGQLVLAGPEVDRPVVTVGRISPAKPTGVAVHVPDRRPVRHPWAKRTRRWKLAHPVIWRRIVRWRKKHPRR